MDTDQQARALLAALRARGVVVQLRRKPDGTLPLKLVLTPARGLTGADREALRQHKETLLDLLCEEEGSPYLENPLDWRKWT